MRFPILLTAALALSLPLPPGLLAQGRRMGGMGRHPSPRPERVPKAPKTPVDEFEKMSPEQQRKALAKLPPERRQKIEERLQNLRSLTPEQRTALKQEYGRFAELPPARQEAVRNAFKKFGNQPPDRQQSIRDELNHLSGMPPEERSSFMDSKDFRRQYNHNEQQIIKDMSDLLPPQ